MKSLAQIRGGNRKTIPVLVALILSAVAALAGATNEMHIDALPAGGKIYTNATITHANPAYAVVSYQEGMVQIPMSNMPAAYQAQFGYTPEKAAQFLDEQKRIQKRRRAAFLARQAALQALAGTNRPVRIIAVFDDNTFGGFPLCAADGINDGILVENLPDSVRQFLTGYGQLKSDIADCEQQINRLKAPETSAAQPAPQPRMGKSTLVGNGAGFVKVVPAQNDNTAAVRRNLEDRLNFLNAELALSTTNFDRYTTIMAHPSGQDYGGKPIWTCIGIPAAAAK